MAEQVFEFEDELIARYQANVEIDGCGVLIECRAETCPCYLLGRNGEPICLTHDARTGQWGVWDRLAPERTVASWHESLEAAVRANQALLLTT